MRSTALFLSGFLYFQGWALHAEEAELKVIPSASQIQQTLNDTKVLFKNGLSDDQAEISLQRLTSTSSNSAQWHMECAMNLLRVAFSCKESNDEKTAQRVAKRVLLHLDRAEKLFAGDADSLSTVYEIRGVVREQLLGDTNQALQSYREAVKQKPDNAAAKQHMKQLHDDTQAIQQ